MNTCIFEQFQGLLFSDLSGPLNLLKLEDIHKLCVLKFYFKYSHNELPAYLQSFYFLTRSEIHQHDTRSKNKLHTMKSRTSNSEISLRHITPKIVNATAPVILNKIYTQLSGLYFFHKALYYTKL